MPVSADEFKGALRNFAAGVTIVTSIDATGQPVGATVSAFASVSVDPPMVLVCLNSLSRTGQAVRGFRRFAVHILGREHVELAQRFASDQGEKFPGNTFESGVTGAPALSECGVRLDCELLSETPGGTHGIFVGLVHNVVCEDMNPLIYANRAFCSTQRLDAVATT